MTGLMRGWGPDFHIVEELRRMRFGGSGHFWGVSHGRGWGCRVDQVEVGRFSRPSGTEFVLCAAYPALEALGYFRRSLRGRNSHRSGTRRSESHINNRPRKMQDLELTSIKDPNLTSIRGARANGGRCRAAGVCGGRDRLPGARALLLRRPLGERWLTWGA